MGDSVLEPFSSYQRFVGGDNVANHSETVERFSRGCDGPEKSADRIR